MYISKTCILNTGINAKQTIHRYAQKIFRLAKPY